MKSKTLRTLLVFLVLFSWFFSGWPPIWQNPRIPPRIKETQAVGTMPTYQAKGAFASGTGALTVGVPTGYQDNDVFLLFVESANQAITTPTGWTQLTNSPQFTGTAAAAGGVRLAVFYKVVSGTQSSVSVADSGNHTTAIIANFRGVDTSNPILITAGGVDSAATANLSWPSVTTTENNALIVLAAGLDKDANDTNTLTGVWTNANLSSLTEQHDQTVSSNAGGGVAFATGGKASTGSVGNTTVTADSSTTHAYLTIALKPKSNTAPTLSISQPDGVSDTVIVGQSYNITYDLSDTEDVATVDFYYDSNGSGLDGTAITGCQDQAEGTAATCSWNTTGMTAGSYYVYGIATDGVNPNVNDYSPGTITIQAAVVSVSISDGVVTYSMMPANSSKTTLSGELNDMQTATNDGNVTENFNIKSQDATGGGCTWTLASTNGSNQYVHQFCNDTDYDCASPPTNYTALTTGYQSLKTGVTVSGTVNFQLRLTTPTQSSCYGQQSVDVTIQAVQQ